MTAMSEVGTSLITEISFISNGVNLLKHVKITAVWHKKDCLHHVLAVDSERYPKARHGSLFLHHDDPAAYKVMSCGISCRLEGSVSILSVSSDLTP